MERKSEVKREAFDLSAIKAKLNTVELKKDGSCNFDYSSSMDHLNSFELPMRRRLVVLEKLQCKRAEIDNKFREELIELEKKYISLYRPLYEDRRRLVAGEREVTKEEARELVDHGVVEVDEHGKEAAKVAGIPKFWLTVLKNNPEISPLIAKEDEPALESLADVRVEYLSDSPGFRLIFAFAENDFFTNAELAKEYRLENPISTEYDDLVYDHAVGTTIDWKDGADLCFKVVTKTQRHRSSNNVRTISRKELKPSFFHFFSPPAVPEEDSERSEADANEMDERVQIDYEIGDLIKSRIIPNAVDWFTGKALDYAEFEEGFDDDYEEDADYDSDEENEGSSRNERRNPYSSSSNPSAQQCKQQ